MALQGPTPEDISKIHTEANQIANQRFLLTTASITVFGVMISWAIPKETPNVGDSLSSLTCGITILLIILLFALYLQNHFLKGMQRICTTYLVATKVSGWEADWDQFRKQPYYGYTKPQAIIFLLLNGIATFIPLALVLIFSLQSNPGVLICLLLGLLFELFIYGMAWHNWFDLYKNAQRKWLELKKNDNFEIPIEGVVMEGHKIASGDSQNTPFPGSTIEIQKPFFKQLGLDLNEFYNGTLNISVYPKRLVIWNPEFTFYNVKWIDNYPAEDFSFSSCKITFNDKQFPAFIYYPYPDTKTDHFHNIYTFEIIAPSISGIQYGDRVSLLVNSEEIMILE